MLKISYKIYQDVSDFLLDKTESHLVFTNGCFDILHKGHYVYLNQSKQLGDILIVGLNSDRCVRQLKGTNRPIHNWQLRAEALAALPYVDAIIYFDQDTPIEIIETIRPMTITKGGDYKREEMIGADFVESYGGSVLILPYLEGYSTTNILSKR